MIRPCRKCGSPIRIIDGETLETTSTQHHAFKCRGIPLRERMRIVAAHAVPAGLIEQAARDVYAATTQHIDPDPPLALTRQQRRRLRETWGQPMRS